MSKLKQMEPADVRGAGDARDAEAGKRLQHATLVRAKNMLAPRPPAEIAVINQGRD